MQQSLTGIRRLLLSEIQTILFKSQPNGILHEEINPHITNATILSGSFNPLHEGHINLANAAAKVSGRPRLIYELSVSNADKGLLSEEQIIQRLGQFKKDDMELVLTRAPFFIQKSTLFQNCSFVIGYDTFVRLIDLKYYEQSSDQFMMMLQQFRANGTYFWVGGRLNNQTQLFEQLDMQDLEKIENVPLEFKDMFIPLKDFRQDISSTEIRKRMQTQN